MTIYDHIGKNRTKTVIIVMLFPILLIALMYITVWGALSLTHNINLPNTVLADTNRIALTIFPYIILAALAWISISYFNGDHMMLNSAHAREISRDDNPEIYSLVANMATTAGLPMPKVYIMAEDTLNAFATGRNPEHASLALTRGIIAKLNRPELEAVIAHELGHIGNRDIRLQMIVITGIGVLTLLGQILIRVGFMRGRGSNKNNAGAVLGFLGLVLIIYGLVLAPLIMYALSRRREYQADATAALMTRNPGALASALEKISGNSRIESLDATPMMSSACIADAEGKEKGFVASLSDMFNTHPSIESRVAALRQMDGQY